MADRIQYLAALDYEHLDNGMFLTALAQSIGRQEHTRAVIVHGDSAYTDRVMQTGVIREEAKIRSIKDLNHRLIALFADEGISAVGINGYQRKLITQRDGHLALDSDFFEGLPEGPSLVISTLIWDRDSSSAQPISLQRMISFLSDELKIDAVFAFSAAEKDEILIKKNPDELAWDTLPAKFKEQNIPAEFHDFNRPLRLTTARNFSHLLQNNSGILIQ